MSREFKLVQIWAAHPEQYDVFFREEKVGYLRLRHGHLQVECPIGVNVVFAANPPGADGSFTDEKQRRQYLTLACTAIKEKMDMENDPVVDLIYDIIQREEE